MLHLTSAASSKLGFTVRVSRGVSVALDHNQLPQPTAAAMLVWRSSMLLSSAAAGERGRSATNGGHYDGDAIAIRRSGTVLPSWCSKAHRRSRRAEAGSETAGLRFVVRQRSYEA